MGWFKEANRHQTAVPLSNFERARRILSWH